VGRACNPHRFQAPQVYSASQALAVVGATWPTEEMPQSQGVDLGSVLPGRDYVAATDPM